MKRIRPTLCLAIWALFAACCMQAFGQSYLSPQQRAVLDQLYLSQTSSINGELIIDGTISTSKLSFAVVLYPTFENHTNDASAHHVRYTDSEATSAVASVGYLLTYIETDPVFLAWLGNNGGAVQPISTVTADYTITTNDYSVVVDDGGSDVTITVPPATGLSGKVFQVKSINDSNDVSVIGTGADTIDGWTNFYLYPDESITIQSDDSNWLIL